MRNHSEEFLGGYYGNVGVSNILHAEVMALYHGLNLCWEQGFRRVACFSDSSEVVKMVETGVSHFHHYGNQIAVIRQLINRNWHVELHHNFRESNQCADYLAKLGAHSGQRLVCLQIAPTGMFPLLLADGMRVPFLRV